MGKFLFCSLRCGIVSISVADPDPYVLGLTDPDPLVRGIRYKGY